MVVEAVVWGYDRRYIHAMVVVARHTDHDDVCVYRGPSV